MDASPRTVGNSAAAFARRSGSGSGSFPATTGPNGSATPRSARNSAAVRMISSELRLARVGRVAPRGDPVPAEHAADRLRVGLGDRGDVEAELEPWPPPRHPHDAVAEALLGELLPVGGGGQRDPGVGMEVVDVRRREQPVHRGVDRRRGAALAVQAEVERRDHLVLAPDAGVGAGERAQPVQPQDGQPPLGEGAEVAAGPLHPHQLDGTAGDGVGRGALGGGVAPGVVGVARVGAQPVAAGDEVAHGLVGHRLASLVGRVGWPGVMRPSRPGRRRPVRGRSGPGSRSAGGPRTGRGRGPGPRAGRRAGAARRWRRRP